jgi:hypothetical protein
MVLAAASGVYAVPERLADCTFHDRLLGDTVVGYEQLL